MRAYKDTHAGEIPTEQLDDLADVVGAISDTELAEVQRRLVRGRVNGLSYDAGLRECGCLLGTVAMVRGVDLMVDKRVGELLKLPGDFEDCDRGAEKVFFWIRPSNTPSNNHSAALAAMALHELCLSNPRFFPRRPK